VFEIGRLTIEKMTRNVFFWCDFLLFQTYGSAHVNQKNPRGGENRL
jgi:hypothetical protein